MATSYKVVKDLQSETEIKEFVRSLAPRTLVVAELFDEYNGFFYEFDKTLEQKIICRDFAKIEFVRFDAGNDLKGFNECHSFHSSHTYPAYKFYQKEGIKGDLKLVFKDYLAPLEYGKYDLTDKKHCARIPMLQQDLVKLVRDWITKNKKRLDSGPRLSKRQAEKKEMEMQKKKKKIEEEEDRDND